MPHHTMQIQQVLQSLLLNSPFNLWGTDNHAQRILGIRFGGYREIVKANTRYSPEQIPGISFCYCVNKIFARNSLLLEDSS